MAFAEELKSFSSSSSSSDESLSSSDGESSSISTASSSVTSLATQAPDLPLHPFSALVQLSQASTITNLKYEPLDLQNSLWHARVSCCTPVLGNIAVEAAAGSRGVAKRNAAQQVLGRVTGVKSPWPASQFSDRQEVIQTACNEQLRRLRQLEPFCGDQNAKTILFSVDVEVYERTGRELLEVGIATAPLSDLDDVSVDHFIVEDHLHLQNGLYTDDNRYAFDFGISEFVREGDVAAKVASILTGYRSDGWTVYLVGHTIKGDLEWLRKAGVDWGDMEAASCDIGMAYRGKLRLMEMRSLERMARAHRLECQHLHNAANDAYWTLVVALEMMDVERMERMERGEMFALV